MNLTKEELEKELQNLIIALDEIEYNRDQWYQNLDWSVDHVVDNGSRNWQILSKKIRKIKI